MQSAAKVVLESANPKLRILQLAQ